MANEVNLAKDVWFAGCDHTFVVAVLNNDETVAIDITGWALSWTVKRRTTNAAATFTKTTAGGTIVISGTFNSAPATNTQRATVTVTDDDSASLPPALYVYELKRTDAGFETVLLEGTIPLERALHA